MDEPKNESKTVLLPPKRIDMDGIEKATLQLLIALGQSEKQEVMQNTPRRVADLYAETLNPPFVDAEITPKSFTNPGMDDPVIVNDVQYVSMCEHHLAPAFGIAHVAYIPSDRVVGYSKLKKALNYLARQPTLNERLVVDTADYIEKALKPKGLALCLRSLHCCIALRTNAPMEEIVTVSAFRGTYRDDAILRAEFWATVNSSKASFIGA